MKIKKFNEELNFQEDWEETNPNVIVVTIISDDWNGIYFKDDLVSEGHDYRNNLLKLINYLIKNNVQMGNYEFKILNIFKNGIYRDYPTEDEYEFGQCPRSLTQLVDILVELGYEVKMNNYFTNFHSSFLE